MKEYLKKLPQELQELIALASEISSVNNIPAYLVGGFVRDLIHFFRPEKVEGLIIRVKNLDLDIVTEGNGIQFAEDLAKRLNAKLTCHRRFGTATVSLGHNLKVDVATSRQERYPTPACLPSVRSGAVKDDLKRRDFSINAMAISLNSEDYGKLIDFFRGLDDLREKKVRILHDLSFIDDPTRILRAIRFEARFNFRIEPLTMRCLKEAVKFGMLEKIQPQRLRDELILILKEENAIRTIRRLEQLAGLNFIHPRLILHKDDYKLLGSAAKQIRWFKKNCSARRHIDGWILYLMAIFDHLNTAQIKQIFKTFVFRRGEEKRVFDYKNIRRGFIKKLGGKTLKPSRVFALLNPLSYETILMLRAKYKNKNLDKHIADFLQTYHVLRLHLTGEDLLRIGLKQGPAFKKIFTKVFTAKLDGLVSTKDEELKLIKKIAKVK